jgi:hypothetical protein
MAKFTPGAIVSEIRNKIAATVFTRNASGAAIRNRITPINRRSNLQSSRRQRLGALASGWRDLSQNQRDSFNAAAANFPRQDNLGQTIIPTGEQLYIELNANLLLIGQSQITSAPAPVAFDAIAATGLTAEDDDTLSLAFTPTVPAGFTLVVRGTRQVSPGKNFFGKSDYRFVQTIAAAATSPQSVSAAYVALFGSLVLGQKLSLEIFLIHNASGIAGQKVRISAIVAAA